LTTTTATATQPINPLFFIVYKVGIFRLAPDADDCAHSKKQINSGEFSKTSDVNVIANLVKVCVCVCV
jgi:hypothetical protein